MIRKTIKLVKKIQEGGIVLTVSVETTWILFIPIYQSERLLELNQV